MLVYKRIVLFVAIHLVAGAAVGSLVVGLVTSPLAQVDTVPGDFPYLVVSDRYDVGANQALVMCPVPNQILHDEPSLLVRTLFVHGRPI